eukprot:2842696-Prorocentrum_lima.AAC.1
MLSAALHASDYSEPVLPAKMNTRVMDMRHEYETVAPLFGLVRNKHIDVVGLGKKLVAQLRHASAGSAL